MHCSATISAGSRIRPEKVAAPVPIVFTGELSIPRGVAEAKAASLGCQSTASVSKKTDVVVVGDQVLSLVGADGMSTKQRKAVQLKAAGAQITIMNAAEFDALLRQHGLS